MKHKIENTFNFQVPEEPDNSGNQKTYEMEEILNRFMARYLEGFMTCCSGVIVGDQFIEDFRVDVQPLAKITHEDGLVSEYPVIPNALICGVGTDTSGLLFSPKQGQTVTIIFAQSSLDEFKGGSITPYEPDSGRKRDIVDAIVIPSIFPFNRSPNRKVRHYTDHSVDDVTLFNNLGSAKENKVIMKKDGSIAIRSSKKLLIDAPNSEFSGDVHVKGKLTVDGNIDTPSDVIIKGMSVYTFMTDHFHGGVTSGTSNTLPPTKRAKNGH